MILINTLANQEFHLKSFTLNTLPLLVDELSKFMLSVSKMFVENTRYYLYLYSMSMNTISIRRTSGIRMFLTKPIFFGHWFKFENLQASQKSEEGTARAGLLLKKSLYEVHVSMHTKMMQRFYCIFPLM